MNRIQSHPVLDVPQKKEIKFYFDDKELVGYEDEMISSALFANGIKIFSYHRKDNSPQGIFCANGQCSQCSVVADNMVVKACITKIKEGMRIQTLKGLRKLNIEKDIHFNYSKIEEIETDVLIIGGGPSGLRAASELGRFALNVILIDDKDKLGGKLVLQTHKFFGSVEDCFAGTRGIDIADKLSSDLAEYPFVKYWTGSTAFGVFADKKIGIVRDDTCCLIKPKAVIFATGAREKTLIFEGNTLPGIYGAGAFQTLLNRDLVKPSSNLFVVGGGNVGLIASYHAIQAGVNVVGLCEIANKCGGYKVHEDKIRRLGVPIFNNHTVLKAEGSDMIERVIISEVDKNFKPIKGSEKVFEVDTLLVAAGLNPVNELYEQALNCQIPSFICGDAEEIAEASAAMFSGRIAAHKVLKHLGFVTSDVPKFWFDKLEVLKSRPGKTYENIKNSVTNIVYPSIHCNQEIPCNPCVTVCPKKSIKLSGDSIVNIPKFSGDCIGCFKCLLICPGLAITIVDKRKDINNPTVWIPFEVDAGIKKGDKVKAVDINGNFLTEAEVVDVRFFNAEKTAAIAIKIDAAMADDVASIKIINPETFKKTDADISLMSDDVIICRCERVKLGDIRKWIRRGVRDLNQLKALTRLGMGACGSKTCSSLIMSIMRSEGINPQDVTELTKRPFFVEINFGSFAGLNKKEEETKNKFSDF
ncbi:MAG: FAD-dependent oxidoreductase [Elusimicrobia bacterium]|nr:FAD-dependent oxidoreductase [Elusimicrobiota bacterium]